MQQQEECWAAEQFLRQQEHLFKQQEEVWKSREDIFHEWERIQLNIRELSKALGNETNMLLKRDMEANIVILINRRIQLADRLNFI